MRLLRFVGFLCLLHSLSAQPQQFRFDRITVEDGLSNNDVYAIFQDTLGFMWFGTQHGLCRYDGKNFKIYRNNGEQDSTSLWNSWVKSIVQDKDGTMWVSGNILHRYDLINDNFVRYRSAKNDEFRPRGAIAKIHPDPDGSLWLGSGRGLEQYNPVTKKFRFINLAPHNRFIQGLSLDGKGNVWTAYFHPNAVIRYSKSTGSYTVFDTLSGNRSGLPRRELYKVYVDSKDSLWLVTSGGLYLFYPETRTFSYSLRDSSIHFLARDVYEFNDTTMWIGTLTHGLQVFHQPSRRVVPVPHQSSDPYSPNSQYIKSIYGDRQGNIWLATDQGVAKYSSARKPFYIYRHNTDKTNSLPPGEILNMVEDSLGSLWISVFGSGVTAFNFSTQTFNNFGEPEVYRYIRVLYTQGNRIRAESHTPIEFDSYSKRYRRISPWFDQYSVYQPRSYLKDRKGNRWVGSEDGLFKISRSGFRKYVADSISKLSSRFVSTMCEDSRGTVWLNAAGLHRYDEQNDRFYPTQSVAWFGGRRHVYCMHEDKKDRFWLGVAPALLLYDRDADSIISIFGKSDGIGGRKIFGILEDDRGYLWLNTDEGIVRVYYESKEEAAALHGSTEEPHYRQWYHVVANGDDSSKMYITNFGIGDGIPPPSITDNATSFYRGYCKLKNGYMVMGLGTQGFVIFHPDSIKMNRHVPPVYITGLSVGNQPVPVKSDSILSVNIVLADTIHLRHNQNNFSLEFAALDYTSPHNNQYKYRLQGYDKRWIEAGNRTIAYYTNIDPGEYRFHVLGSNNDGVWNEKGASVLVIISPPWWKTTWAYAGYILFFISLVYAVRRYELIRQQHKHLAEMEHREAENLKEIDKIKTRFFANISHEFRTPLTLIEGPLKQLLSNDYKGSAFELYELMLRNTRRLLRLVNQLLDLAKLESRNMKLSVAEIDIVSAVRSIAASFESTAARRMITFKVTSNMEVLMGWVDIDALEKILNNLLSNAFKFTREHGSVSLSLRTLIYRDDAPSAGRGISSSLRNTSRNNNLKEEVVEIAVTDTGIGIPSDQIGNIFDRFYQVDASHTREQEGTGIGLSLVKELVELHKGAITVQSEWQKGTTFTVQLPIGRESYSETEIINETSDAEHRHDNFASVETYTSVPETKSSNGLPSLLIIEDNADMRRYIRFHIEEQFSIVEAVNGEEGVERAINTIPDLIISDVMMPKMDGFEVCKRLKSDHRTSHIPIILLTAKAGQEHKMEGLETGADEYLVKPFDAKELLVRLNNLQEQRKRLREHIQRELTTFPKTPTAQSANDKFLQNIFSIIEQNIGDTEFDIQSFAEASAMSRMQLYRKIKSLTGYSPGELLRNFRLQRASELLKQRTGNVSEIAYEVGYNNLSHFAAQFRDKYGVNPSEFV
ncbi:MAG: hybrid sensor histidine kinase/response regulator transcription factor [Bacteroidota bacterium]